MGYKSILAQAWEKIQLGTTLVVILLFVWGIAEAYFDVEDTSNLAYALATENKDSMDSLEESMHGIDKSLSEIHGKLDSIDTKICANTDRIEDIKKRIYRLEEK